MQTIYLFHGEDSYSSQQKTKLWKGEFIKKYDDLNIQILEGESLTHQMFSEAVNTVPFLTEKKLIIVNDFFRDGSTEEQKLVAEKLDNLPEYCVIVFSEHQKADQRLSLFKKIKKTGTVNEFSYMEGYDLSRWIQQEVARKEGQISTQNASLLAQKVGPNLWQMSQEIEKLVIHADGKQITAEAIESLVSPNLSESIFNLTDAIAQKRQKQSIKTLHTLIGSGEDLMQILFMIVRHFRIMIQIKSCLEKHMSKQAIASETGLHPYVIQKTMPQAGNFSEETLARIYRALLKIDSDIKGGGIKTTTEDKSELRLAIEKLIVQMSR